MPKHTNTVPYTNARRAGRTNPEMVEIISVTDPRHRNNQGRSTGQPNRAARRANGERNPNGSSTARKSSMVRPDRTPLAS